ncbi:MAG: DUF2207 domain-containing protein, partial [Candidatus Marinimicrobia bacterium]|nr:DUF2207 domain-containing protein [Candidatus Neomarinimicrobiota bacterium]
NDKSSDPYTFKIIPSKKSIKIRWYHHSKDETKEFVVSYKLRDAIRIGPEDAQFHWTYLGSEWDKSANQLRIEQRFEEEISKKELWFEATGIKQENRNLSYSGNKLSLATGRVSHERKVRINTIFPSSYFTVLNVNDKNFSKSEYFDDVEQKEKKSSLSNIVSIAVIIFSIFWLIARYLKHGRAHKIEAENIDPDHIQWPTEHHPALVSYLYSGQEVTGHAILGTLMRLGQKGCITVKEIETTKKSFFRTKKKKNIQISKGDSSPQSNLDHWDKILLEQVNSCLNKGENTLDKLFTSLSYDCTFMSSWKKEIKRNIKKNHWKDSPPLFSSFIFLFGHLLMIGLEVYMFNGPVSFIAICILLGMGIIGAFAMSRLSREAKEYQKSWKTMHSFIKRKKIPQNHDLDMNELLQYSIVIDAVKGLKNILKNYIPKGEDTFIWFGGSGDGSINMDTFSSSISSMVDTGAAMSAGFAGDGGAGGGAGGGGGGGAG